MNSAIQSIIKMLTTLKLVVSENEVKLYAIPAFVTLFSQVLEKLTTIENLEKTAIEKTKGTKESKNSTLELLCAAAAKVAEPVLAYANATGNVLLATQMTIKRYQLQRLSTTLLISTCRNIHTSANAVKIPAADYNLTTDKLNNLDTLITAFAAQAPQVRQKLGAINASKKDLTRIVEEVMNLLENQLDFVVQSLVDTEPTLVELWQSARVIVKPSSTSTQLKATVTTNIDDVATPLAGIAVSLVDSAGKAYPGTTNADGEVAWKPIQFGLYTLKCEAPGYLPFQLKDVRVKRGQINKADIDLTRDAE